MKATFTYAVRYWVHAVCLTPLRTGGADGDTELVLRGSNGQPLLQGSSLAGAMREWMQQQHGTHAAEGLFGSQKQTGRLIVSEGRFTKSAEQSVRPRVRIDPRTGSAEDQKKFDLAQLNAGSAFDFSLIWLGQRKDQTELQMLEEMLSALHGGTIRLGAQKSNGFGRVNLTVEKQTYDMMRERDRTDWLREQKHGKPLTLSPCTDWQCVTFTLTGQADSILVKSAAVEYTEDKKSYIRNLRERDLPILPGSSVKGAVRAQAERIAQCTGRPALVEELFGRESCDEDNGQAGKVRFEDVKLDKDHPQKISRIRINRFTGGVIHQGLFVEEPLCSPVVLKITAPANCPQRCALLLYALRDLGLGLYNLGSGGSIGRGYLHVEQITAESGDRKAKLTFRREEGCTVSDPNGLAAEWMNAWKEDAR